MHQLKRLSVLTCLFASSLIACAGNPPTAVPPGAPNSQAAATVTRAAAGQITSKSAPTRALPTKSPPTNKPAPATNTSAPSAVPTADQATLYLDPALDSLLRATIEKIAASQKLQIVSVSHNAGIVVATQPSPDPLLLTDRVYVVADRFATLRSGVKLDQIKQVWSGQATGDLATLIVTDDTANALTPLLGPPGAPVQRVQAQDLVNRVWKTPRALALLPFDRLEPRLIALPLDGLNALDRTLDMSQYGLVDHVYVEGTSELVMPFFNTLRVQVAATNRDPNHMTSIVMTGVTAMGRFTADAIDKSGDPGFPARVVAPILSKADITHVSNEIPFVDNCPPNLVHDSIRLCSKPEYIETFRALGVDIVGLTGNHAGDFGYDNYVKTLELYEQNGMKHYAGGRSEAEARAPLVVEHNGNKIAFLGANSFGPQSYWATPNKPGSNGYDAAKMREDIAAARKQATLVFVEYQADEVYDYTPDANNVQIFQRTIRDGADVVTGVQNHHPASLEFPDQGKKEILYGLGNFSFDQMYSEEVRQGLIPRHLIYEGRLMQTELLTTMLYAYAQPRWATPAERERILRSVFQASGFALP